MSSPTKRPRRTKAEMESIKEALRWIVARGNPMTVRQVFYQTVTHGVVDKTEAEYKGTVCRLLTLMRRDGTIPYEWIADSTRWMRKPVSHTSVEVMLRNSQRLYRRDLWAEQADYIEVWCEKEALAGVIYEVTERWDVPLMVTRGYPSVSFLFSAASSFPLDKRVVIYYLGDHDPSGQDIGRQVKEGLEDHYRTRRGVTDEEQDEIDDYWTAFLVWSAGVATGLLDEEGDSEPPTRPSVLDALRFDRIAVNEHQIDEFSLPTRPTKRSDSRAKNFVGESVELDALSTEQIHALIETAITSHLDQEALQRTQEVERVEREALSAFVGKWKDVA